MPMESHLGNGSVHPQQEQVQAQHTGLQCFHSLREISAHQRGGGWAKLDGRGRERRHREARPPEERTARWWREGSGASVAQRWWCKTRCGERWWATAHHGRRLVPRAEPGKARGPHRRSMPKAVARCPFPRAGGHQRSQEALASSRCCALSPNIPPPKPHPLDHPPKHPRFQNPIP